MKAAVIQNARLLIQEVEPPKPKANEVLIRVRAASVNRVDMIVMKGSGHGAAQPIPGLEWGGEIVKCGADVPASLRPGIRVVATGSGGFAEYAVADWGRVLPIPSAEISIADAAALPLALMTMHDAIVTNGVLKAGETVLIQSASSGVGLIGLQLAKLMGAGQVIGTSTDPARAERLRAFGADKVLNSSDSDWADQALAMTAGKGVELIIDHISGGVMNQNMKAAAVLGRIVNVGRLGGSTGAFDFELHALKRLTYVGVTFRTRSIQEVRSIVDGIRGEVWQAAMEGRLRLPLDRSFALSEADEAMRYMESGSHLGKIVLIP